MTLFEHLENLCYSKKRWKNLSDDERKTVNMFMINRFLSMHYPYIELVNELQTLNLPPSVLYEMYIACIPKQKQYLKYIKKSIKEIKGDEIDIISNICEVPKKEAKDYLDVLDKKQLEELKLQISGIKEKKKK